MFIRIARDLYLRQKKIFQGNDLAVINFQAVAILSRAGRDEHDEPRNGIALHAK